MRFTFLFLLVLQLQSMSTSLHAQNESNSVALKKIVVQGTVSGPDLWKVSNGENVLWILGTLSPLPKRMDWNSEPIEEVIKSSQTFLLPPTVTAELGFFKSLSLAKSVIGIKKNPDKQKLQDVVPADLYSRWLVLKTKYIGNSRSVEKTRPIFAGQKLFDKALKMSGLTRDTGITKKLRRVAKRNKVELVQPKLVVDLDKPKSALKKFKKTEMNDLECFTKTIERIETDLNDMQIRAVAWSYGDIETIKALPYVDDFQACSSVLLNSELAKDIGMTDIRTRLRTVWLDAAKKALENNKTTFAILPITQLLREESILNDFES
ncbi:MAG: TraB/GumN family protein, partial [Marinicella sp.]